MAKIRHDDREGLPKKDGEEKADRPKLGDGGGDVVYTPGQGLQGGNDDSTPGLADTSIPQKKTCRSTTSNTSKGI